LNKKLLAISLLVIGGAIFWMISNKGGGLQSTNVQTDQVKATPTSKPTPSPTPLPINRSTNLDEALKSLTPKDYSQEYSNLTN
jgi:hypothetical protein